MKNFIIPNIFFFPSFLHCFCFSFPYFLSLVIHGWYDFIICCINQHFTFCRWFLEICWLRFIQWNSNYVALLLQDLSCCSRASSALLFWPLMMLFAQPRNYRFWPFLNDELGAWGCISDNSVKYCLNINPISPRAHICCVSCTGTLQGKKGPILHLCMFVIVLKIQIMGGEFCTWAWIMQKEKLKKNKCKMIQGKAVIVLWIFNEGLALNTNF